MSRPRAQVPPEVDLDSLKQELARMCHLAWHRRLVSAWGGNISVRVPGTDLFLITPSGVALADVTPEGLLTVSLSTGQPVEARDGLRPSKETGMHITAYTLRPEVGAVAHLHPPYATAFSTHCMSLPLVVDGAKTRLKVVPCVGWAPSGSPELHHFVEEGLRAYPQASALLLRNHGLLALGRDLKGAVYTADLVEDAARIALLSRLVDQGPYPLVPDSIG